MMMRMGFGMGCGVVEEGGEGAGLVGDFARPVGFACGYHDLQCIVFS